jgi:hypothetical protein
MATVNRSRVWVVAAALVLFLEGGTVLETEAFVLPSGLATQRNLLLPETKEEEQQHQQLKLKHQHRHRHKHKPLRSFKFIKGETSYGDLVEGAGSSVGFGGTASLGTNSFSRGTSRNSRRSNNFRNQWWSSSSGFSRSTPTTLLAAGSLESWPVMEADDIKILVRKGEDLEDDLAGASSSSVKATLERWERDISLEVVGQDGYPMLGNQMQPNNGYSNNNNGYNNDERGTDRCTQSISFDVADGDVYPFSGTISVPPPLTVEDSIGNQKTVMMVLNNRDDESGEEFQNQQYQQHQQYDDYGNAIPSKKHSSVEAMLEPLYKSPDQKYAEAQQQQQLQYDEYGNEIYNPQQEQYGEQKTTIPSQGYQSFQLDATDPATGKIKISLEREDSGSGGFGNAFGGGGGSSASEARIEIHHGFRDQYGNPYSSNNNNNNEEQDRRISLKVSTMHPTFSSVVDTMPANLLAKHALPSLDNVGDLDFIEPYLEVRIVNTGGAALKAGVQSFLPQYRPQSQKERETQKQNFERQKYKYEQRQFQQMNLGAASTVKADDPFLLVDSTQSTTSSRRMNNNRMNNNQGETAYVRASSGSSSAYANANANTRVVNNRYDRNGGGPSINEMWSTGAPTNGGGMKANMPGEDLFRDTTRHTSTFVQANASNRGSRIQSRISSDYYDYDAIDTVATPKGGSTGLIANNDFSKANSGSGSTTSAIVPGSMSGGRNGYRRVSPSSLQSFGGNSGGASGMQQPFQGRSQNQYQSQNQYDYQSQSLGGMGGMQQPFQGRSQSQNNQSQSLGGGSLQQSFQQQTSPQRTRTLQGQQGSGRGRSSSAFSGNGNVIGNGVISGRPADSYSDFGKNDYDNNNGFGGAGTSGSSPGNGFRQSQSSSFQSSFTPEPSNTFGGRGSNNNDGGFGGEGNSNNNFMGSMKQKLENTFGGNNNNQQQRNGGRTKNTFGGNNKSNNNNNNFGNTNSNSGGFGGASNSNNNNNFGNANNNSGGFGGASNNNNNFGNVDNNSGDFGGGASSINNNDNSGSPFGNLGTPPQTRANSKNPFAKLNGETNQQQPQFNTNGNGNSNSNNNAFGGTGGGGAPQRPLSPSTSAMKNPFAGLNGNKNNGRGGPGGSTTAMRSSNSNTINNGSSGDYENPILGFAKNLVKGIGDYGNR